MSPLDRIRLLGGAARFAELGTSRYQLARLVERGDLVLVDRGCYALPGAPPDIVTAARTNTTVGCISAVQMHDPACPVRDRVTHLTIDRRRGHRPRVGTGTRLHYGAPTPSVEIRGTATRLAPLERAVVQAAQCQPYDQVVTMLDHLVHERGPQLLEPVLTLLGRTRPGRARALASDVDGSSRSPMETALRLHLRRAGLAVAAAPVVPGVGEVDFIVEGVLIVELDGYQYHSDRLAYRTDRRRDRQALRLGLATARFAFEDSDPARVLREIVPICRSLRRTPLEISASVPADTVDQLAERRSIWVGPSSRATGWRHLTGVDALTVRRGLPDRVIW
ncbi:hypothetical protein [Litorihabitans aurantiacus]|uniref:DUF559 domain-containing protein n=1 Tax=Litorihabitans aurantiacus TaxID=1930061 RepID=A0AA37XFV2_9MICO|nr:hypothetical protein [Litorihabitans aurantiacus]GMA32521.1 hypothetical protein GCM10025875_25130 [Litorihabitans aurantiacus]